MMRTALSLLASLVLAGSLGAASQFAPGVFHLHNHPDGNWKGPQQIAYGMILTDWIENPDAGGARFAHVIFDFDHPDATMKLQNQPSKGQVRIFGQALAYGSMTARPNQHYVVLGMATVDLLYTGGEVELEDGSNSPTGFGEYADVLFFSDSGAVGSGPISIDLGDGRALETTWAAMADTVTTGDQRTRPLLLQLGDYGGDGLRMADHPEVAAQYTGMFTTADAATPGSGDQPRGPQAPGTGPDLGNIANLSTWGENDDEEDDSSGKPSDVITILQPRRGNSN